MRAVWQKTIVITGATAWPIDLDEAKAQLRIDGTDSDTELQAMIAAACNAAGEYCNRLWARATVDLVFSGFPWGNEAMVIPLPDVESISSVKYLDDDQAEQTLAGTSFDSSRQLLKYTAGWPQGTDVVVRCVAGPDAAASPADYVPQEVKQAMLMLVADMYEHRAAQSVVAIYENKAARFLLGPHRVTMGV